MSLCRVYHWADGKKYVGEWLENMMHGQGEMLWPDGMTYKGEYVNDKKHGQGVFRWSKPFQLQS